MAEYDLTQRMVPFLDLHLVIPLLEFLEPRKLYDRESFLAVQRRVLGGTQMLDTLIETYGGQKYPPELDAKKAAVLAQMNEIRATFDPVAEILEKEDVKELMDNTKERDGNVKIFEYLQQNHNFTSEMVDVLFKYAKLLYESGNYNAASISLHYYRNLVPHTDPNYLNALYGKLASEILLQEFEHARDDLVKLRAYIDSNPFDTEWELLQQRAWLMHWALFVYFNYPKGREEIIEMFLNQQTYLNTIQERHSYEDPVTDFLTCLYIKHDFDEAQEKLRQCEEVLSNDFFLTGCLTDFLESARLLIFEMFCRIHRCVSIEMLARRLNMSQDQAERWIVDLIRNYHVDGAKIDSQLGQVVMGIKAISIHEQVLENTKRLTLRAQQIALQLEKARSDRAKTASQ